MEQEDGYSIEHYSKEHNGLEFDCGDDAINDYFKRAADEHVSNNSTVYVCISKGSNQKELIGFFTLCSSKLYCKINGNQEKNHPCILLGQLGVNKKFQHKNWGKLLVEKAKEIAKRSSIYVAAKFLLVETFKDDLIPFYESKGFIYFAMNRKKHQLIFKFVPKII